MRVVMALVAGPAEPPDFQRLRVIVVMCVDFPAAGGPTDLTRLALYLAILKRALDLPVCFPTHPAEARPALSAFGCLGRANACTAVNPPAARPSLKSLAALFADVGRQGALRYLRRAVYVR
jgi:hypothetical protein